MTDHFKLLTITTLMAVGAMHSFAVETVVVESRNAAGELNTPSWSEVSGKWGASRNKTRVYNSSSLVAGNVSICTTNAPAPAFKISPDLQADTTYKVEVTFGMSRSFAASPDLIVAVAAEGTSTNTIPINTTTFQQAGANQWNTLGTITPSTNSPSLTFTYVSGTLSRKSRWYADAIRFVPEADPTEAK